MNVILLYAITGVVLFGIGIYGLIGYEHFVRKTLAVNVMSTGVFIFLVSIAGRSGEIPDPVPHALVLTGIVVAVCATALMLAISLQLHLISEKNPQRKDDHAG